MNFDAEDLRDLVEEIEEDGPVDGRTEDRAPAGPSIHDVVPGPFELYSERSRHVLLLGRRLVGSMIAAGGGKMTRKVVHSQRVDWGQVFTLYKSACSCMK
jgi:hypothetical protein